MTRTVCLSYLCMSLIKLLKPERTCESSVSTSYHTVWKNKLWNHNKLYNKVKHLGLSFLSYTAIQKWKNYQDLLHSTMTTLLQAIFNRLQLTELLGRTGNHPFVHFHYPRSGQNCCSICHFQMPIIHMTVEAITGLRNEIFQQLWRYQVLSQESVKGRYLYSQGLKVSLSQTQRHKSSPMYVRGTQSKQIIYSNEAKGSGLPGAVDLDVGPNESQDSFEKLSEHTLNRDFLCYSDRN